MAETAYLEATLDTCAQQWPGMPWITSARNELEALQRQVALLREAELELSALWRAREEPEDYTKEYTHKIDALLTRLRAARGAP